MNYLVYTVVGNTGWLMVLVFVLMIVSAVKFTRAIAGLSYRTFLSIHNLYVLLILLVAVHSPHSALYLGPAFILFLGDKMKQRSEQVSVKATLQHIPRTDVVQISFDASGMNRFRPGQYIYISRNEGERTEMHPISIASSTFDQESACVFVFAKLGTDWTQ